MILFGPLYVRTQYYYGSLQIASLQLTPSVGKACELLQAVGRDSPLVISGCSVLTKNSTRGYDSLLGAALRSVSSTNGSRGLAEDIIPLKPRSHAIAEGLLLPTTYQNQVLDRTKVLHGPRTQTYGETNYLKIKFWTELRYCMVFGLKPMGKLTT